MAVANVAIRPFSVDCRRPRLLSTLTRRMIQSIEEIKCGVRTTEMKLGLAEPPSSRQT